MSTSNTPAGHPPPPTHLQIVTPSRRAISAEPPTTLRRTQRTPTASGRKVPTATTPHGRAAIRAISSRRAAIFTPNRGRRRSLRDLQRETPRDPLRALSRLLAPRTEALPSSSSSPGAKTESDTGVLSGFVDDDDDGPLRPPRLSLPIDEDDEDDSDIHPHRSAGLEDTIEMPRRAISEQPRYSLAGGRMSDFYGNPDEGDRTFDSAFFPPLHAIDEDAAAAQGFGGEEISYAQFDADDRRATGRESDFGIVIPPPEEGNETTFMISAEAAEELSSEGNEPFQEESHVHFGSDVVGGEEDDVDDGLDRQELDSEPEVEVEPEEFDVETEMATAKDDAAKAKKKRKPGVKVSKHGIQYPSLPPATVKRLAQTFAKTSGVKGKISPDTLAAIMQASDWFFEQLGDDLQAFAKHAGRKTIDESDMLQVMRRYVTFCFTSVYVYPFPGINLAPLQCTCLTLL